MTVDVKLLHLAERSSTIVHSRSSCALSFCKTVLVLALSTHPAWKCWIYDPKIPDDSYLGITENAHQKLIVSAPARLERL